MVEALPIACGPLNLRPEEFGGLTPREFDWMLMGHIYRQRRDEEVRATAITYLVNGRQKTALRPEKILGRMIGPKYDEVDTRAYSWRNPRSSRDRQRRPSR